MEKIELAERLDDSFCATRAAMLSGAVAGGGSALYTASRILNDRNIGHQIIKKACRSPLLKICENAGLKGKVILTHFDSTDPYYGFDALHE